MSNAEQRASYDRLRAMGLPASPVEDQPYGIEFHSADGVFIKQMHIPKVGTVVPQHVHAWTHLTMLACGSVRLWKDGEDERVITAPAGIEIEAGIAHTFQSLEDNTVLYCCHGLHSDAAQALLRNHELDE